MMMKLNKGLRDSSMASSCIILLTSSVVCPKSQLGRCLITTPISIHTDQPELKEFFIPIAFCFAQGSNVKEFVNDHRLADLDLLEPQSESAQQLTTEMPDGESRPHQNILILPFYSTPSKGHKRPPKPPVSSITEDSDCDRDDDFTVPGVQPLVTETEEVDFLESSMHSLSIAEEHDSPDEGDANDLRNSFIEMDDCWVDPSHKDWKDGDSSDEDFPHPIPPELESQYIPDQERVLCEEDLVGKSANITYNNNLHRLAMYLMLACRCEPPFQVSLKPRGTGVILEWVR
ncbi:unnamed protein product [Leuciscus chuanchicus]